METITHTNGPPKTPKPPSATGAAGDSEPQIPTDLIQLHEAAPIVKACRQTILRWILCGKLRGYRCGHRWRVSKRDLLDLVQVFTAASANDKKIQDAANRPETKRERERHEQEVDAYLRKAKIRK
jgi:excisionase family DNA binding protein